MLIPWLLLSVLLAVSSGLLIYRMKRWVDLRQQQQQSHHHPPSHTTIHHHWPD
jgi:hypothetical protein